jgi:uncharacterized membrane protein
MSRDTRRRWWWALWATLAASAVGIALFAGLPYATGDPDASRIPLNPDVAMHYGSVVIHGLPGALVLLIGPLQFVTPLRVRYPGLHRVLGRVYMIGVLVASLAALVAAVFSISGFTVQVAFFVLAAAWLYSLAQAYRSIRQGRVQLHRVWMVRNYTLTFAAVTLRLYIVIGASLQGTYSWLSFENDIYVTAVWLSVLGNVLLAEYFIVHRMLRPLALLQDRRSGHAAPPAEPALVTERQA